MFHSLRHEFDPLDREILERAFYAAWDTFKGTEQSAAEFDDDESLAAVLRSRLIEVAQTNSFSDAEALRDMVLNRLSSPKA